MLVAGKFLFASNAASTLGTSVATSAPSSPSPAAFQWPDKNQAKAGQPMSLFGATSQAISSGEGVAYSCIGEIQSLT